MNSKFPVFLGITTILTLLAGAYALGATRHRTKAQDQVTAPAATKHNAEPNTDLAVGRVTALALADMQNVARREFGSFRLQPDSLGSTDHWSRDHLLHWVTIEHDGREIRLYHVTEKAHPEHRHTATWSSHEPYPTRWQPVQ
jgi:hypothetical protein